MAVESRFVVIRQGVEVETFMDKKSADEYDKMLDIADNLSEMFEQSPLALDEKLTEELSVYLAKHKEDLLVALQVKKAKAAPKAKKPVTADAEPLNKAEPAIEQPAAEVKQTAEPVSQTAEPAVKKTRTRKKVAE